MNPLTINAAKGRVRKELREIHEAWPEAEFTVHGDNLSAVAIIREPGVSYIITVTPDGSESLWVTHNVDRPGHAPDWTRGWVD